MSDVAIRVEGLGKRYRIGERERYHALRDVPGKVIGSVRRWSRLDRPRTGQHPAEIWALKDISFEVGRGDVVGIIGRNGAGKSTLLKILSRITEPTEGRVELHGRVGSLLEVGTGFHPELTGRENVYFNGAVLGMKKAEIDRKFDEIVAFAELEQFVDTPVKHYSSGMQMRLAFAVAAHLDPETLVVDEVLAVGDMAFQKKCLAKMSEVAQQGRTVLLVSHQLNQIRRLCGYAIWLVDGHVGSAGSMLETVAAYEASLTSPALDAPAQQRAFQGPARFIGWEIAEPRGEASNVLAGLGPVVLRVLLEVGRSVADGHHGIALFNSDNQLMWATAVDHLRLAPGTHTLQYTLPSLPLRPGTYQWHLSLYDSGQLLDLWYSNPQMIIGTEPVTHPLDAWQGVLNLPCTFEAL